MPAIVYFELPDMLLQHGRALDAAAAMGCDVVFAGYRLPVTRDSRVAHYLELQGDTAEKMAESVIRQLTELRLTVDGVVAWRDAEMPIAAHLAARLRLPFTTVESTERVRSKVSQRKALESLGGVNPRFAQVTSEEEFLQALDFVGTPAVLKPAGASGARGIFYIDDAADALATYRQYRRHAVPSRDAVFSHLPGIALLEERLVGTEHSVGGVIDARGVHVLSVADKRVDLTIPVEFQNQVPSRLADQQLKALTDMGVAAVTALELGPGGFHVDAMVTTAGPRVLEVGARLGGFCINSHVVPAALGVVPYELLLAIALGRPLDDDILRPRPVQRAGMRLLLSPRAGSIESICGFEFLEKDHSVLNVVQTARPGDRMRLPRDEYRKFWVGYFVATSPIESDFDEVADFLAAKVGIEIND